MRALEAAGRRTCARVAAVLAAVAVASALAALAPNFPHASGAIGATATANASSVNFFAGDNVANDLIAKVSTDGKVSILDGTGSTHVLVDVVGWFAT